MKKRISAILALVMALSMVLGMTVFAVESPSGMNTPAGSLLTFDAPGEGGQETSGSASPVLSNYIVYRNGVFALVGTNRVAGDYSNVSDNKILFTAIQPDAKDAASAALDALTVDKKLLSKKIKLQGYIAGKPVVTGFGTMIAKVSVGNAWNGKTASVIGIDQLGQPVNFTTKVANGYVTIPFTVTETIVITAE